MGSGFISGHMKCIDGIEHMIPAITMPWMQVVGFICGLSSVGFRGPYCKVFIVSL